MESIAPSIYGHLKVKRAIAVALFGGEPKDPGKELVCQLPLQLMLNFPVLEQVTNIASEVISIYLSVVTLEQLSLNF